MLVAIFGVLLLHNVILQSLQTPEIPYDEFHKHLKDNRVREVVISQNHIRGVITEEEGK